MDSFVPDCNNLWLLIFRVFICLLIKCSPEFLCWWILLRQFLETSSLLFIDCLVSRFTLVVLRINTHFLDEKNTRGFEQKRLKCSGFFSLTNDLNCFEFELNAFYKRAIQIPIPYKVHRLRTKTLRVVLRKQNQQTNSGNRGCLEAKKTANKYVFSTSPKK